MEDLLKNKYFVSCAFLFAVLLWVGPIVKFFESREYKKVSRMFQQTVSAVEAYKQKTTHYPKDSRALAEAVPDMFPASEIIDNRDGIITRKAGDYVFYVVLDSLKGDFFRIRAVCPECEKKLLYNYATDYQNISF